MHIYTYSFFIFGLLTITCTGCIPTIPPEDVGFVERIIDQLEALPDPPQSINNVLPAIQDFRNELVKANSFLISKTSEVAESPYQPFKETAAVFAGCQINQIKFTSPETGKKLGRTIIPPDLKCVKKSLFGCDVAHLSCKVPADSKYPLISGFAKIDKADWATTDLTATRADFKLDCDIFNRWTYISDIPGLEGRVYPTNEVSCLLVPIITEMNQVDFQEIHYDV